MSENEDVVDVVGFLYSNGMKTPSCVRDVRVTCADIIHRREWLCTCPAHLGMSSVARASCSP